MGSTVTLGLGSNLGNKMQNLISVVRALPLHNLKCSKVYLNPAMLDRGDPCNWHIMYYNIVVMGKTQIEDPRQFLARTKSIEKLLGRISHTKHCHPRIIDIDILFWDKEIISEPDLCIPHPKATSRPFTLKPLNELMPCYKDPRTGQELRAIKVKIRPFRTYNFYNNNMTPHQEIRKKAKCCTCGIKHSKYNCV